MTDDDTAEIVRLRESVDRLTADRGALQQSTDNLTAALGQVRAEMQEVRARTDTAQATAEEVGRTSASKTSVAMTNRVVRRRMVALVVAILIVGGAATVWAWQQHRTSVQFSRVSAGLISGCTAREQSDNALRAGNERLQRDTAALAAQFAASPAASQLGPVLDYLNKDAAAYADYLKAIPPPVDCRERYGLR